MSAAPLNPPRRQWGKIALGTFTGLFVLFTFAPILIVVVVSFSADSFILFPVKQFSVRWYVRVAEYRPFVDALIVSLVLAVGSALLGALLGVPAALALAQSRGRLGTAITTFLLSPISIPAIVLGFALLYYLASIGIRPSLLALFIAHTVIAIPYLCRTVLAVLRTIPPSLEESAQILGAGRWARFRYITLPLLRPGIFAGGLFAALVSLDNLPLSFFFGTASANTLPVVMLSYMQNQFDPAIAAISTIQMAIAIFVLLLVERFYGLRALIST